MLLDMSFLCAIILFIIFLAGARSCHKRGDACIPWMFKCRKTETKVFYILSVIFLVLAIVLCYLQIPVWTCNTTKIHSWQPNNCQMQAPKTKV